MAQEPMPENVLVIPIKVDFLFVKEGDSPLASAKVDFSRLPYNDGSEDVNSEFAYVSENFISQPFQNNNLFLRQGLHLHWALPDAFTAGKMEGTENDKQIIHTQVPDRWLVNKKKNNQIIKSWVVESNYLHPVAKDNKYHAIAYPVEVENGQPFRYMGRSYCFYDKSIADKNIEKLNHPTNPISPPIPQPSIPVSPKIPEYLDGLTAMGYGEHTFAAYYPNCRSVFGFCDTEIRKESDLAQYEYEVLGWYSKQENDPLIENDSHTEEVVNGFLNFDGADDYINCGNSKSLQIDNEITIEAWVKMDADENRIMGKFEDNANSGWFFNYSEARFNFGVSIGGEYVRVSSIAVPGNQWHHVAGTYNKNTGDLCIYVDGVVIRQTGFKAGVLLNTTDNFDIGRYLNSGDFYFNGSMNEVRVWNIERTQEQIKSCMNIEFDNPQAGLVAYYKFNQGEEGADNRKITTLIDSSGNRNNGQLNNFALNGITSNWFGRSADLLPNSSALDFDGVDDFINCGNDPSVQISGTQITLEAWIYPTAWKANVWQGNIINKESDEPNYGYMLRVGANAQLNFNLGSWTIWPELTSEPNVLSLNKWQHVAGTYDGNEMKIYVNGKMIGSKTEIFSIVDAPSNLFIGNWALEGQDRYFNGKISEVRIWNTARSMKQIQESMNVEFQDPQPGLVANYRFNQGFAESDNTKNTKLIDSSGNGNHGVLSNFALNGTASNWVGKKGGLHTRSSALNFDGADDYITVMIDVNETDYTAEMWFRTNNMYCGIFSVSKDDLGSAGHDRHIYLDEGNIGVRTWNNEVIATSQTNYADGKWHHVAHVIETSGQKIYIDGVLKSSGVKPLSDFDTQDRIHIGYSNDAANNYFDGSMSGIRIWSVARTQEQIQSCMNNKFDKPQSGLVAYYKFDQGYSEEDNPKNTTLTDSSGNGNHGTLNNFALTGPTSNWVDFDLSVQAPAGALDFDGESDYIEIPTTINSSLSVNLYTVETWVKFKPGYSHDYTQLVGQVYTGGTIYFSMYLVGEADSGNLHCGYFNGSGWITAQTTIPPPSVWTHIAATYDSQTIKLYINGFLIVTLNHTNPLPINDLGWLIGKRWDFDATPPYIFNGSMAEVRIWNIARTQQQIQSSMSIEFDKPQSGLVAYYKFKQGLADANNTLITTLTDSSGNGNQGDLINFSLNGSSSNWVAGPPFFELASKLKKQFDFRLKNAQNFSGNSNSLMSLCYARLKLDQASNIRSTVTESIAIGNTGTEALSAYLAAKIDPPNKVAVEEEIEAVHLLSKVAGKKLNMDSVFDEAYHEKGFATAGGGYIWSLRIESVTDNNKGNSGKKQGTEITLPDSFADWINDINQLQQQHDRAQDELISLQQLLFADWYKYMVASYHPDIEKDLLQMDDVRFFIEEHSMPAVDEKKKQIEVLNEKINGIVANINSLIALFNCGFEFDKVVLDQNGIINKASGTPSEKLVFQKFFYPENKKPSDGFHPTDGIPAPNQDAALEGVYVSKYSGSESGESITVANFKSISFWINISKFQPVYGEDRIAYARQLIKLSDTNDLPVDFAIIDADGVNSYWQSVYINGEALDPNETIPWTDIPK